MRFLNRKHQRLLEAIERAKSIPVIIVEGKKDLDAMAQLGFNNVVVLHKDGFPLHSVFDKINGKECAILTDIDRKGKQYYFMIKEELEKQGIRINNGLRKAILANRISHIEGLATFVSRISS